VKLVYSRNRKPEANTSPGMEFFHVRDEPERLIHVAHPQRPGKTLCGARIGEDIVPRRIVLPNCGNCFASLKAARAR
jgi:hypothetical protein